MLRLLLLAVGVLAAVARAVDPQAVYDGGYNGSAIALKIGNGGAGQSGLIEDAYIKSQVDQGKPPFKVAWYLSDNTVTIQYLQAGTVDVGITYNEGSERVALSQRVITQRYYAFRDHFLLVGPASNPANVSKGDDISLTFANIFAAAENTTATPPTRFLSRFDKSATNIKESSLWLSIGQAPWATAYSTWYHQYISFPVQALTAAIQLQEYTLTDRGTYLSVPTALQNQTVIYKAAADNETDPLLNPAHLLIGAKADNKEQAATFAKWLTGDGQQVVTNFTKNGQQLYSEAPKDVVLSQTGF